ncbi:lasso peptide isopeptide bond-forming cyclase [Virgibacillus sp. C22-A2]|uniref:asparagine synthase (glutamine-hydrolyzing) n=1 Tax=Virgibacillus tibetensis TaxID=3042313 RepID=A0ABU6KG28_9BACI|nr:lasso peptide isopeptide bond-forming cyclase [Virgibacillus sp. C22-A2]
MSAIAGIYHLNKEPISREHNFGMMQALQKYPADDAQMWQKDNVFLGCHAQWITPESVGEQLPYYDYDRQLAITVDAIIDNRDELFNNLQVDRPERKLMPDSQLILLAYCKWGEDTPKHLIGDFAFMIWDEKKQKLFGARDFSGTRTLYYFLIQHRFAFCTTIEPLLTLPYVQRDLNEQWLAEFMAISGMYETTDASITPYQSIMQIPPSHSISVTEDKVKLIKYCTVTSNKQLKLGSGEAYVEAFQEIFQEAVNSRLRTSQKVGVQLSGGLDSGAVASFAAKTLRERNQSLDSFSYIPSKDFSDFTPKQLIPNERAQIHSTVSHVGSIKDHYLDFYGREPYSQIDDFLDLMEMPYKFFENSFWLEGLVEKANEEGVGVLLNGDRGNFSISWGSSLDYYAILLKKIKWIRLYQELDQYSRNMGSARLRKLPHIFRIGFPFMDQIFSKAKAYKLPSYINMDFAESTDVFKSLKEKGVYESFTPNIYEERKRHFEEAFYWNSTNTLAAKLSLRYSVWKRDPTNDLRVVRFCLSIPEDQYVQKGLDRALVRNSTKNFLPDEIRLNQRYRGVQGVDWVQRITPYWNIIIEELKQISSDSRITYFIDGKVIKKLLQEVEGEIKPEYAINPNFKVLMRCLILSRFLKKHN